jgi:hypothetical protein
MPKIVNHTDDPAEATTKHVIPAKGELAVSEATLHRISNEPYIARRLRAGELTIKPDDPEPEAPSIDRTFIAKATRAQLLDVIVANSDYTEADMEGITVEDREDDGETVDGLRTIAARIVFGGE